MLNKAIHFIFVVLLVALVAVVFYFDKGLMMGTDNSYYLDLSYWIAHKQRFLIDFIDYRIPVFSFVFSFLYKFDLSDFTNLYIMLVTVYSFYCVVVYTAAVQVSKSKYIALFVTALTFISLSSRQFEHSGRNITMPLFHYTLELCSVLILLRLMLGDNVRGKLKILSLAALSGLFFGLAFIGRQLQTFPAILMFFYCARTFYKERFGALKDKNLLITLFSFSSAFMLCCGLVVYHFYTPDADFFHLLKKWFWDFPHIIYPFSFSAAGYVKSLGILIFVGLPEIRYITIPLFWVTYLFLIMYAYGYLMSSNVTGFKEKTLDIYNRNKKGAVIVLITMLMCISATALTRIAPRHESPYFTFYAMLLAYLMSFSVTKECISKYSRNFVALSIVAFLVLPMCYNFYERERESYRLSSVQDRPEMFDAKLAASLKRAMNGPGDVVVPLGGYSLVGRLAEYRPFMGLDCDNALYGLPKLFGEDYANVIFENMKNVNVFVKLPDYPNVAFTGGDETNAVYRFVENYLASNFKVFDVIEPANFYPHDYTKGAIIYKRVR